MSLVGVQGKGTRWEGSELEASLKFQGAVRRPEWLDKVER